MDCSPSLAPGFPSVGNVIKHWGSQNTTGRRASPFLEASLVSSSRSLAVKHTHAHTSCICQIHTHFFYLSLISMQEVGIFHCMPGRQDQTGSFHCPEAKTHPWIRTPQIRLPSSGPPKSFQLFFCLPSCRERERETWQICFWQIVKNRPTDKRGFNWNDSVKHWTNASQTPQLTSSSWDVNISPGNQTAKRQLSPRFER